MSPKLSSLDVNALGSIEKHGELILSEDGKHFRNSTNYGAVERKRVERLASLGHCRIDVVGQSTFAVFVGKPVSSASPKPLRARNGASTTSMT